MSEGPTPAVPAGPGETPPRTLDQAPGERYAAATGSARSARPSAIGPARVRSTLAALGAAVCVALALGVGILVDWRWPLLIISALGGWLIGAAAWYAAWDGLTRARAAEARIGASRVTVGAMAIALAAWFVGQVLGWFFLLAFRPDSALSLGDRLAALPFLDWLAPQFGPLEVIEILLLVGLAWFAARPR